MISESQDPPAADKIKPPAPGEKRGPTLFESLRRRFIGGIITIIPALVTIYAVFLLMSGIDYFFGGLIRPVVQTAFEEWGWSRQWVQKYIVPVATATVSLIVAIGLIILIGELARWFLVRKAISLGEMLVERIPLVRFFYRTPKEVIKLLTEQSQSIKRPVLVEFPRPGVWAVAYATGEIYLEPDGEVLVAVFMPTTPNPTTGFMMMLPQKQVRDFNVTASDSLRMIISGGILSPKQMTTRVFSGLEVEPDLPPPVPLTSDTIVVPNGEEKKGEE